VVKSALLCAALIALPAGAQQLVARWGRDVVHFQDAPCASEKVLHRLDPALRSQYRAAAVLMGGQPFTACWRMKTINAHLVYEDGDEGIVPLAVIRPVLVV
jgi:hypothetical protein